MNALTVQKLMMEQSQQNIANYLRNKFLWGKEV